MTTRVIDDGRSHQTAGWTTLELEDKTDNDYTDLRVTPSPMGNFYIEGGLTHFSCFSLGGTGTGTTWTRPKKKVDTGGSGAASGGGSGVTDGGGTAMKEVLHL